MIYDPVKNISAIVRGVKNGEEPAQFALQSFLWEKRKDLIGQEVYQGEDNGYTEVWFNLYFPFFIELILNERVRLPRLATNSAKIEWLSREFSAKFQDFGFKKQRTTSELPDGFFYKLIGGIKNRNSRADNYFAMHLMDTLRSKFYYGWLFSYLQPHIEEIWTDSTLACLNSIRAGKFPDNAPNSK